MITETELVVRLALATILAASLGLEREARNRAAGIRTHTLVGLGAALFTIAGAYGFGDIEHGPNVDPARIAAQVVSGIGFIGAGAIIRSRGSVRGITTAATLWLSAALGVAAAAGAYVESIATTVMALLILIVLRVLRPYVRFFPVTVLRLEYARGQGTLGPLIRAIEDEGGAVTALHLEDDADADGPGIRRVVVEARALDDDSLARVLRSLRERPEVRSIATESSTRRWRANDEMPIHAAAPP